MLSLKKIGLSLILFLLIVSGSSAQTITSVENATLEMRKSVTSDAVNHKDTNTLPIFPRIHCIPMGEDSVDVALLVSGDVHSRYYFTKKDGNGFINLGARAIWVFAKKEIEKQEVKGRISPIGINKTDTMKRFCQFLGLGDIVQRDTIVYLRVRQTDMFRPAYQTNVNATVSQHRNPVDIGKTGDPVIDTFLKNEHTNNQYPWTRLGYTYDWGSDRASHFGMTEFIVKNSVKVRYMGYKTVYETLK